ncbi:unnamed protein product, partial [Polarella glacialis]
CFVLSHCAGSDAFGCDRLIDEETRTTGAHLLDGCSQGAAQAFAAAAAGQSVFEAADARLNGCIALTERLVGAAFQGDLQGCPEASALVLSLQGAAVELDSTERCTQTLLLLVKGYSYFGEAGEPAWAKGDEDGFGSLVDLVHARRAQCAAVREQELEQLELPSKRRLSADLTNNNDDDNSNENININNNNNDNKNDDNNNNDLTASSGQSSSCGGGPERSSGEQPALLVAATPNKLRTYQPFLNLWRCYALRHGMAFILETDDTEVSPPHQRAPNWLRWFTARRYLGYYKALLIVDPDQFVVPECWNMSIPAILGAWAGGANGEPDVATRDFGKPQTLNNGVVLIRSSPRGNFFLDQLLAKAAWMQTIEKDQGAFDETVLEVLGLEARERGEEGYHSECSQYFFPNANGNHEIALYALCWWRESERLAGPFGARRSSTFRFADPRIADVNHVAGSVFGS